MCVEPTTAVLALSAVSAVMGAASAIQQGQAAKKAADYRAAVARNNKIIADRAAADAIERGKLEQEQKALEVRALRGRQRAVLAGAGIEVDVDTALDVTADTITYGKHDQLTILNNAEREAYNLRVQGNNFESEARLAEFEGKNAQTAGFLKAGTALTSGAASVADKWYQFKKAGAFGGGSGGGGYQPDFISAGGRY